MSDFFRMAAERRSVRAWDGRPVGAETRSAILEAMRRAPTAGNLALYSVIEVEDPAIKTSLAKSCDDQPFIATAPWVLVFLADYQRVFDWFQASGARDLIDEGKAKEARPREGDLMLACCDALIAAQTLTLAAEALGLGSCYIGDIMERYEEHRSLLDLPPYVFPITMLCLGWPAPGGRERRLTSRLPLEALVHRDRYHRADAEKLRADRAAFWEFQGGHFLPGAANAGQHVYLRKFSAAFSEELRRSVAKALETWR